MAHENSNLARSQLVKLASPVLSMLHKDSGDTDITTSQWSISQLLNASDPDITDIPESLPAAPTGITVTQNAEPFAEQRITRSKTKQTLITKTLHRTSDYVASGKTANFCVTDCKNARRETSSKIRCGICCHVFHCERVGEDANIAGGWICLNCRSIYENVTVIKNDMDILKHAVKVLIHASTETMPSQQSSLITEVQKVSQELVSLCTINGELMQQLVLVNNEKEKLIAEKHKLEERLSQNAIASSEEPVLPNRLLIGSSVIQDIHPSNHSNLDVKSFPGADMTKIVEEISQLTDKYDEMIIVAGSNDCDNSNASASNIIDSSKILLDAASNIGKRVTFSSVLPRVNVRNKEYQKIADKVNDGINKICQERGSQCQFINNDNIFKLSDQSPNDALYAEDGCHLNKPGANKLISKLNLKEIAYHHRRPKYNSFRTENKDHRNSQDNQEN